MARARNIKPGFFRNADLVELPVYSRLLFIGLWTLADREGRLEDRPKQIKMEIFPADSVDCDAMLDELASTGMIQRYTVGGNRYLQVVNFAKHQNPHRDEKASTLPDTNGHVTDTETKQTKHRASTVQTPCKEDVQTVPIGLIPDPLIPDPLIPEVIPSVAKATGGKPPLVTDPNEIIFGYGLPMLTTAGTPEKQARSFLGGLRKHHGDDALIDKLRECAKAKPLQPLEWLAAALPPDGPKPKKQTYTEFMVSAVGELTGKNTIESEAANVFAISRS